MTCYGPLLNNYDGKEIKRGKKKESELFSLIIYLFFPEKETNPHFAKLMEDFEKNCFGTFDFFIAGLLEVFDFDF